MVDMPLNQTKPNQNRKSGLLQQVNIFKKNKLTAPFLYLEIT